MSLAVFCNFLLAIFLRNEVWLNTWYHLITNIPKSAPLWLRHRAARYVYSIGGRLQRESNSHVSGPARPAP